MRSFMNKPARVAALLVLMVMDISVVAGEPQEWKFEIRYEIAGIAGTFPAYHREQCLSNVAPMPDITTPGQQCSARVHGWFGDTLTWQVDCSSDWEIVQGVGRVTFDKGRAGGDVHFQILSPGNAPEYMVFHIEGASGSSCGVRAAADARSQQTQPVSILQQVRKKD